MTFGPYVQSIRTIAAVCAAVAFVVPIRSAAAADNHISIFGGWRTSGTLRDDVAQRDVRLRDQGAASAALDLGLDSSRQLQIFASRQSTSLAATPIGTTNTLRLPVKLDYLHIGGTNFFEGSIGSGPYVAGGLGFTRLAPGLDGFESETRPSLSIGIGYLHPLGSVLALRLEGRGYWTLVNSSGALFCSGGCLITIKGDSLAQIELLIGLSLRF